MRKLLVTVHSKAIHNHTIIQERVSVIVRKRKLRITVHCKATHNHTINQERVSIIVHKANVTNYTSLQDNIQ